MATIDVKKPHALSKEDAKKRAEEFAKSMQQRFELNWKWEGEAIKFESTSGAAKGTKGQVSVSDKEVRVEIDLPFLLRAIKGTIESKVHEKLDESMK